MWSSGRTHANFIIAVACIHDQNPLIFPPPLVAQVLRVPLLFSKSDVWECASAHLPLVIRGHGPIEAGREDAVGSGYLSEIGAGGEKAIYPPLPKRAAGSSDVDQT